VADRRGDGERCGAAPKIGRPRQWPCKRPITPGSDRDGQKGRCWKHGGKNLAAKPGADERGGRPPTTFTYRRFLPAEERKTYDSAHVGHLDDEIKLARANLARFLQKRASSKEPGVRLRVEISGGRPYVVYRPWHEIELEHLSTIRRLELARQQLLAGAPPPHEGEGDEDYEAWVSRFGSEPSSSPDSSRPPEE